MHVVALGKHGGSLGSVVAHREAWWLNWEAWWLNGSAPDCCPTVPGSNPASPQPTAHCKSPGGLPPGMALGCGLTSVRGDRGEYYKKITAASPKKKKIIRMSCTIYPSSTSWSSKGYMSHTSHMSYTSHLSFESLNAVQSEI
jgi:hypothetical protein